MKLYYKRKIKSPSITFIQLTIFIIFYEYQLLCHHLRMYFKEVYDVMKCIDFGWKTG